jgi:hypothetical protein
VADDPLAVLHPQVSALDLDDDDADVRHEHDDVELVVLLGVGEAHVRQQNPVGRAVGLQARPHLAFGLGRELRVIGDAVGAHAVIVAATTDRPGGTEAQIPLRW